MISRSRPVGEVFTWDDFRAQFLAEYLPESLRLRKAFEFKSLTCEACGSVDAYARRFIKLCGHAPTLVATDEQKVGKFMWGLPASMQKALIGFPLLTFGEMVDKAH